MNGLANACWHCGEPLPARDAPVAMIGGQPRAMCCQGCRAAAEWIEQLGLADYYRLRSEPARRPPSAPASAQAWSRPGIERHLVRDAADGTREAVLLVEGIRCSACVWLIERSLGSLPGIERVQVNATARRARVVWRPDAASLEHVVEALARTGYEALPLDAEAIDDARQRESRAALKRLVVAGFGAMQAMMYATGLYLGAFHGIDDSTRDLLRWFGLLVATPVV
ncbi:MAG TPA: heavy metal translocating P-type ATPase metal-binding domain-containing protein, partial [Dokdonella sp.]